MCTSFLRTSTLRTACGALASLVLLASLAASFATDERTEPSNRGASTLVVSSNEHGDGLLKSDLSRSVPVESSVDRMFAGAPINESSRRAAVRPSGSPVPPADPDVRRAFLCVYRL